jgi:long-chain fatty acid transport protein
MKAFATRWQAPAYGKRMLWLAGGLAGTMLSAAPAMAGGFYLQDQSTKASGRAFSGEVADRRRKPVVEPRQIGGLKEAARRSASPPSCRARTCPM